MATSELYPFSKTGGLADVSAALGRYLHQNGHDVRIFSPLYATIDTARFKLKPDPRLRAIEVAAGGKPFHLSGLTAQLPNSGAEVFFIHCPELYDRPSIYTSARDEHLRFILLSRAVFECCQKMKWRPDVLHCHDWQTALIPLFRRSIYAWDQLFENAGCVLTIHNIGYQGLFPAAIQNDVLNPWDIHLLHQDDLRAGLVNFLKTGVLYADVLTTVSPSYATEIQTDELGAGLQEVLRARSDSLHGILNGVDYDVWSPQKDPWIEKNYNARGPVAGKTANKKALLQKLGLPYEERLPLVAMVTRLVYQKGIDLLFETLPGLLEQRPFQFVALGSGETKHQDFFRWLQTRFPSKACFYAGCNDELAHLLQAGADMFLMPSRYEPCGLNQMYSLKYGTAPVVRKTGGLADTVRHFNPETGEGNGFVFEHFTPQGVAWALNQALDAHGNRKLWLKLMRNAMAEDFSWEKQVKHYLELYARLAAPPRRTDSRGPKQGVG